jgi:hypothetical protein
MTVQELVCQDASVTCHGVVETNTGCPAQPLRSWEVNKGHRVNLRAVMSSRFYTIKFKNQIELEWDSIPIYF